MVAVNVEVSFGGVTQHVFRTVGQQIVNAKAVPFVLCASGLRQVGVFASLNVSPLPLIVKAAASVLGVSAVRTLIAKVAPSAKQNQQIPPSHTQ